MADSEVDGCVYSLLDNLDLLCRSSVLLLASSDDPPLILLSPSNANSQTHRKVLLVDLFLRLGRVILNDLVDFTPIIIVIKFIVVEVLVYDIVDLPPDHLTAGDRPLDVLPA